MTQIAFSISITAAKLRRIFRNRVAKKEAAALPEWVAPLPMSLNQESGRLAALEFEVDGESVPNAHALTVHLTGNEFGQ